MLDRNDLMALPPEDMLHELLTAPEDQWFDRKSSRVAARDLAKTIIAMANADGGLIAIGLHDGTAEPISPHSTNAWRQAAMDFARPAVRTDFVELRVGDGENTVDCALLTVERSETVVTSTKDEVFLRVGDEDRLLTFDQRRELVFDKGQARYEETVLPDVELKDLDHKALAAYGKAAGASDARRAALARGLMEDDDRIRVAGIVGFAYRPDRWLPQHVVRVIRYTDRHRLVGTRQNITLDERVSLPLGLLIPTVSDTIRAALPTRRALTAAGVFETVSLIPEPVWLEALVNAVVHRSYSNAGDHIRVEIFEDALTIESPGRFPGVVDVSRVRSINRYARNPRIARLASDLGLAQELGEGIRRMFQDMSLAGLVEPSFHQTSGSVQVLLSGRPVDAHLESRLPRRARDLLVIVRHMDHPSTGDVVESSGLSRPVVSRTLQALEREGLIERIGTSAKDPRAYWKLRDSHEQ